MQQRRTAAYGVLRDDGGQVLLVRGGDGSPDRGAWRLPGGDLRHAEHPAATVVRGFAAETGLAVTVAGVRAAVADVATYAAGSGLHTDRLVFDVTATDGVLRPEQGGGSARLGWFTPESAAAAPVLPFTAELLGLSGAPLPSGSSRVLPSAPMAPAPMTSAATVPAATAPGPTALRHRFGAYGLVTDPAGRVLLTLIAEGYPGAGSWHLPGGGTDYGEAPETGLLRELVEESGQVGRVVRLIGVDSFHHPSRVGPEGRPLDWHTVRAIYTVVVEEPTEARVLELAGGSTARASWFGVDELSGLRLSDIAARTVAELR
ncbi:NUDIX hydrolase [Salinispora pacifica]|uniref:NUDIX hydrolase n=1 Tax=Salinispora pacifica TaxID=351187 RepID=UPI0003698648|nr:NUDIX domain-containing protein [Salinispora pacifica]